MKTLVAVAAVGVLPLSHAIAASTTIAGDQICFKESELKTDKVHAVIRDLTIRGWIEGWLSATNRIGKADWLANVRVEHINELISKYCQGDATVEQAGLSVLGQLRMEYAVRGEYKRQTEKDAPQE